MRSAGVYLIMADTGAVSMAALDAEGRTAALLLAIRGLQERNMAELMVNSADGVCAASLQRMIRSPTMSCTLGIAN